MARPRRRAAGCPAWRGLRRSRRRGRRPGCAGVLDRRRSATVRADTIFRISSMTKPVTAVAALILVEECVLRLDDPVDALAARAGRPPGAARSRRAARRHRAGRSGRSRVRDLLTFRLGLGMDFAAAGPSRSWRAMAELGLGAGPPARRGRPAPDEWMRRLGTLPLEHQPGERWLYHTGADVLGVLVARASGRPFEAFLRERIFEPLGMRDTGFCVPAGGARPVRPLLRHRPGTGDRSVYDPADGQWSAPPAVPVGGGGGLVSTRRRLPAPSPRCCCAGGPPRRPPDPVAGRRSRP